MPGFTYISDSERAAWRSVPNDAKVNGLLQDLRTTTGSKPGDEWLVGTRRVHERQSWWQRLVRAEPVSWIEYILYYDTNYDTQVLNLVLPGDCSTTFTMSKLSREAVCNYILGYISGYEAARRDSVSDV